MMKTKAVSGKILIRLAMLMCVVGLLIIFHENVLTGLGSYLSPEGAGSADLVVLEGTELIESGAVEAAMRFMSSGAVNGLVIVVHQPSQLEKKIGLPNYPSALTKDLEYLGLGAKFQIILTPIEHPITLNEAKTVLPVLTKKGVRRVILLTSDFHTRRSYWAYREVGLPLGIEVIPHAYFVTYQRKDWWNSSRGIRDFSEEAVKFIYYLLRGYIPLKSVFTT